MIVLDDKNKCCGCWACVQCCPKKCISMKEDEEGFLYPVVNEDICIDCGLCEKVCPVIHQEEIREPLDVYAAINPDEAIRLKSSSGGVFTSLAEYVIQRGGVVFGACFNSKWEVVHDYTETIEGLEKFRGSKYVQSRIGDCYKQAEDFLKEGRFILFSGTPCQISGLHKFLRKDYDKLLTMDFICHGVPSPGVFRTYLRDEIIEIAHKGDKKNSVLHPCIPLISERDGLEENPNLIKSISFRDKRNGWKKYGFTLELSKASAAGEKNTVLLSYKRVDKHPFLEGFLKDLYLRPSCYACPSKGLSSGSDITLGDYWGIESTLPELDDDKGISVITVNTSKGKEVLEYLPIELHMTSWNDLKMKNKSVVQSAKIPNNRILFFVNDGKSFKQKIKVLCKVPFSIKRTIMLIILTVPKPIRTYVNNYLKKIHLMR